MGKIIGVVLAGGKSRRFGSPKAFAQRNGKEFYKYSVAALKPLVSQTIIVTNDHLRKLFLNEKTKIIVDEKEFKNQGPLAGIFTAMNTFTGKWYIVVPIDVPFLNEQTIKLLLDHLDEDVDAVIPVVSGQIQPLIAIYRFTMKNVIKKSLTKNKRSVHNILSNCAVKYVSIKDDISFYNINSKADYNKWIK